MELLRVEHLSRYYGEGPAQVKALDDVSFSVEKGEFVAIMGPSGSGKSTLMHLLGGVDKPTAGHVWLQGTDLYKLDENALAIFRRRQIGLVYQFYNLLPVLNGRENLTLPLLLEWTQCQQKPVGTAGPNSGHPGSDEPSAPSAFRRSAAEGQHWPGSDYQPCPSVGR